MTKNKHTLENFRLLPVLKTVRPQTFSDTFSAWLCTSKASESFQWFSSTLPLFVSGATILCEEKRKIKQEQKEWVHEWKKEATNQGTLSNMFKTTYKLCSGPYSFFTMSISNRNNSKARSNSPIRSKEVYNHRCIPLPLGRPCAVQHNCQPTQWPIGEWGH